MKRLLRVCALALVPLAAAAEPVALKYDAYVGPAHAGVIRVQIEADAEQYLVKGSARSKGLVELLKDTRGWFSARGRFAANGPELEVYEYYQKDRDRERFVSVSGGQLSYVKNGEARPLVDAHPGTDLVTALWVLGDCASMTKIHTGRSGYTFDLVQEEAGSCQFSVTEDDEDEPPFELQVTFEEVQGSRVPVDIRSTGGWAGRLILSRG